MYNGERVQCRTLTSSLPRRRWFSSVFVLLSWVSKSSILDWADLSLDAARSLVCSSCRRNQDSQGFVFNICKNPYPFGEELMLFTVQNQDSFYFFLFSISNKSKLAYLHLNTQNLSWDHTETVKKIPKPSIFCLHFRDWETTLGNYQQKRKGLRSVVRYKSYPTYRRFQAQSLASLVKRFSGGRWFKNQCLGLWRATASYSTQHWPTQTASRISLSLEKWLQAHNTATFLVWFSISSFWFLFYLKPTRWLPLPIDPRYLVFSAPMVSGQSAKSMPVPKVINAKILEKVKKNTKSGQKA